MVSRRKILSRSTDDLNLEAPGLNEPEEEDVWFNKDKLYKVGKDQQFRALNFLTISLNFLKVGPTPASFSISFCLFAHKLIFVVSSRIQTQIIRVEGEEADH